MSRASRYAPLSSSVIWSSRAQICCTIVIFDSGLVGVVRVDGGGEVFGVVAVLVWIVVEVFSRLIRNP